MGHSSATHQRGSHPLFPHQAYAELVIQPRMGDDVVSALALLLKGSEFEAVAHTKEVTIGAVH